MGTASGRFFGTIVAFVFVIVGGARQLAVLVKTASPFPSGAASAFLWQLRPQNRDLHALGLWIALPLVGMLLFVNLGAGRRPCRSADQHRPVGFFR